MVVGFVIQTKLRAGGFAAFVCPTNDDSKASLSLPVEKVNKTRESSYGDEYSAAAPIVSFYLFTA